MHFAHRCRPSGWSFRATIYGIFEIGANGESQELQMVVGFPKMAAIIQMIIPDTEIVAAATHAIWNSSSTQIVFWFIIILINTEMSPAQLITNRIAIDRQ